MGTTVVVVIVSKNTAYIAHAGDSRAYLLTGESIRQLTTDHSVVQVMVDRGELTADEARCHPRKNLITRALGVKPKLDIDYCECPLADGDIILMCSDGLSNYVEESELYNILRFNDGKAAVDKLINTANANGGGDNITAVAICC
jgi:protein phosphatase